MMFKDLEKGMAAMTAAQNELKGASEIAAMSFLFAMFDHICERWNLDKAETLETMNHLITQVNEELGNMYQ